MTPLIRPATREDIPLILEFVRALAEYEKMLPEVEATQQKLQDTLFPATGSPAAHCVFAYASTELGSAVPVGFAIYFYNFSTFLARPGLYLEDLFVKPEWRGKGFGKALLLHLAGVANARGCGRMEWTVLDWNQPAIEFYESLGAQRLKTLQICRLTGDALRRAAAADQFKL